MCPAQALWSIRDYVSNTAGGNDGQHAPLAGWFWWCWNANSGDTGGLVRGLRQLSRLTQRHSVVASFAISCAMRCWQQLHCLFERPCNAHCADECCATSISTTMVPAGGQ